MSIEIVRNERDEALQKLDKTRHELNEQTDLLKKIVSMVNQTCEDELLSFDDFMFYWKNAIESDQEIIVDQLSTFVMMAKILFGEELHKKQVAENKARELQHQKFLEDKLRRKERRESYKKLRDERTIERNESISRRIDLLKKIFTKHSTFDDLSDKDRVTAEALIKSNNLKESFWLKRLIVLNYEDVPPEKHKEYYECHDHRAVPYEVIMGRNSYV